MFPSQADDLSPDDFSHFVRRNRITCAIGWTDFPFIPTRSLPLHPGDGILLCTDGLHDNLADREIEEILRASGEAGAQCLVSAAFGALSKEAPYARSQMTSVPLLRGIHFSNLTHL